MRPALLLPFLCAGCMDVNALSLNFGKDLEPTRDGFAERDLSLPVDAVMGRDATTPMDLALIDFAGDLTDVLQDEPDAAMPPDLSLPADQSAPADQSPPADISMTIDMTAPIDMSMPTDMSMATDMSTVVKPSDLAVAADQAMPADLNHPATLSFAAPVGYMVGAQPLTVATADLDKNGTLDLVVSNSGSSSVSVLLGKGDGSFSGALFYPTSNATYSAAAGDLDGDGFADLVAAVSGSGDVELLTNNQQGGFGAATVLATGITTPRSVTLAAFETAGVLEPAVGLSTPAQVQVFHRVNNAFVSFETAANNTNVLDVTTGDFNNDGTPDIASANYSANTIGIVLNQGKGTFKVTELVALAATPGPRGVTTSDFDGDGKLDVLVAGFDKGNVTWLAGKGDGTFTVSPPYAIGGETASVSVADFNLDGKPDLCASSVTNSQVVVLLGTGKGAVAAGVTINTGSATYGTVTGDFNGDGLPDIAATGQGDNRVYVLLNTSK